MFTLARFGTTTLPDADPAGDMNSLETLETGIVVAGGMLFDTYGTDRAPAGRTVVRHVATQLANTAAALETAYRALLARRGDLDKLFRYWPASNTTHEWVYARLLNVRKIVDVRMPLALEGIVCEFELRSPHWNGLRHGLGWALDDGEYLDSGLALDEATGDVFTLTTTTTDCAIQNAGDVPQRNLIIDIYQLGATALTALTISEVGGVTLFSWSNGSGIGQFEYLRIDTGTKTVKTYGGSVDDEYGNFTIGTQNPYEDWIELPPGEDITIRIQRTGGNSNDQVVFTFYDAYA